MSRWYDKRPQLGLELDRFKLMNPLVREPILNELIELVKLEQPSLLSVENAYSFRFDSFRLRWYEHDPHCWFLFNILESADINVIDSVENHFDNTLSVVRK
ncbi:MAG: hypothetical protein V7782_05040 [Psychromonas sp.]